MTKRNMIIACMIIAMCWISACSEDNLVESPSDDEQQIEKKDGTVSGDSPRLKVPDHLLARDKEISVSLKWIESVKMTSGFVDSIDISLTNNTAADLNVLLKMYFSGLIEMSATKEMGQVTIPAYKTEIVRLAAVDIPIQSSDGSLNASAEIVILDSDGNEGVRLASSEVFYRHSSDLTGVMTFDMTYLTEKLDGELMPATPSSSTTNGSMKLRSATPVLRKIIDRSGRLVDVSKDKNALVDIESGKVIGTIRSTSIRADAE